MDKQGKGNRIWLNPKSSCDTGALSWEVSAYGDNHCNANLNIRDCSRQVSLDFDWGPYAGANKKQRLKKLRTIINELEKMYSALEGEK